MTFVLRTSAVGMSFGGVQALRDIDLSITEGEWVGLIGPNGSGKSTLLNVLSGVYLASSGTVTVNGSDISVRSARRRARSGIVRTFQHPQLAGSLTIRENVELGGDLGVRGKRKAGGRTLARHRVDEALELFGCHLYQNALPDEVPYGVRKMAEVARAAAAEPEILLLDEPAAGLSAGERTELIDALTRFRASRPLLALCLVEHDVSLVRALVGSIVVLHAGQMLTQGAAADVLADERVKAAYLGKSGPRTDAVEEVLG
jgi:ABC-type branched-subunit amino acid transport system ATPase component